MGCSASRHITILAKHQEDPSSFSSYSAAYSAGSSPPQVPRALSFPTPLVHHPPTKKGDTHHLVCLTSTTYGSLLLIDQSNRKSSKFDCHISPGEPQSPTFPTKNTNQEDPVSSLSPDSVINTWELMDGLDDFEVDSDDLSKPPLTISEHTKGFQAQPSLRRHTMFDGSARENLDSLKSLKSPEEIDGDLSLRPWSRKPLWQHFSEESLHSKMNPNVDLSNRRALSSTHLDTDSRKTSRSVGSSPLYASLCSSSSNASNLPLGTEDRIVLYFTSLRGIRKTYDDCSSVRMMLKGFRVAVDERDISMESSYRKELQNALGGKQVNLPQVFIRGKYIGGAEEMKRLNEVGELSKLLEGFPVQDPGFVCQTCGNDRFVPCSNCKGSRKIFEEGGEFRRCPDCNENGLIRCPYCSS